KLPLLAVEPRDAACELVIPLASFGGRKANRQSAIAIAEGAQKVSFVLRRAKFGSKIPSGFSGLKIEIQVAGGPLWCPVAAGSLRPERTRHNEEPDDENDEDAENPQDHAFYYEACRRTASIKVWHSGDAKSLRTARFASSRGAAKARHRAGVRP